MFETTIDIAPRNVLIDLSYTIFLYITPSASPRSSAIFVYKRKKDEKLIGKAKLVMCQLRNVFVKEKSGIYWPVLPPTYQKKNDTDNNKKILHEHYNRRT
jgi:hypothetical protein